MNQEEQTRLAQELGARQRRWEGAYQLAASLFGLAVCDALLALHLIREWRIWFK